MSTRMIEEADCKRRRIETNSNNIIHGPFDLLPDEVVTKILSFVPFPDLALTMWSSLGNRRIRRLCRDLDVCWLLHFKKEWDLQTARRIINMVGPRMKKLKMRGDNANSDLAVVALERSPLLKSMVCDERILSSSVMGAIGRRSSLRYFFVSTAGKTENSPWKISANIFISNVPNLKTLTVLYFCNHVNFDDLGVDLVTPIADHCKNLEVASFPYLNSLTDAVLDYFLDKVNRTLNHLSCYGHLLTIGSTSNLKSCHLLKDLQLVLARQLGNEGLLTIIKELSQTTTRLLINTAPKITRQGFVKAFTGSRSLVNLTWLVLAECSGLDDVGLDAITKRCPNLVTFDFSSCSQIGDRGVRSVLRRCQKLAVLKLVKTAVSAKAFVESNKLKKLAVNSDLVVEISRIMPYCHVAEKLV